MALKLTVIDYGMGNIWSVTSAFRFLNYDFIISNNPTEIKKSDVLVLPGVGSFNKAMTSLKDIDLIESIHEAVIIRHKKILGICLGMQLFFDVGTEDGLCHGLGLLSGRVERFHENTDRDLKIPHVGFNRVYAPDKSLLFRGIGSFADFYFLHSYRVSNMETTNGKVALCHYGSEFVAAYEHENVFATQFHPEKSQTNGLRILSNFMSA